MKLLVHTNLEFNNVFKMTIDHTTTEYVTFLFAVHNE